MRQVLFEKVTSAMGGVETFYIVFLKDSVEVKRYLAGYGLDCATAIVEWIENEKMVLDIREELGYKEK